MKNKIGGNQAKKKGRKNTQKKTFSLDDLIKGKGEEYAYVQDKFGDGRFNVICYDKVSRLGIVRGKIKNYCRIQKSSLVLISIRDFEDGKCDILYEYLPDDIDKLLKNNIISESFIKTGKLASLESNNTYADIKFTEETLNNSDDDKLDTSNVWESDDEEGIQVNNDIPVNNYSVKQDMNIDDNSSDEELDIDDI